MFHSLLIRNSPLNKTVSIEFSEGLNVLKGKNSSGKSTVIEMLNYSLFGSSALRSPISSYDKDFYVESRFSINNIEYKVERKVKDSALYIFRDNKFNILTTGITPTNDYLKSLLTYDYKIFSLTNFCKQHDLLKLTSSTPSELVNLIEVVSGLDSSYKLLVSLKDQRKECKGVIKSLRSVLSNLEVPDFEEIEEYESLLKEDEKVLIKLREALNESYVAYTDKERTLKEVSTLLDRHAKKTVQKEGIPSYDDSLEEVEEDLQRVKNLTSQIELLEQNLPKQPENIEEYSEEFLDDQENLIAINKEYSQYLRTKEELEKHKITCPECDHTFYNNISDTLEDRDPPEAPQMTPKGLREARAWNANKETYQRSQSSIEALKDDLNSLRSEEELGTIYKSLLQFSRVEEELASIEDELESLDILPYEYSSVLDKLQIELEDLERINDENLKEFNLLQEYINNKKTYLSNKNTLDQFSEELEKNKNDLETYNLLYDTLIDVKKKIQTESFPVINSIASNILSEVTGGERNKVFINDQFKIEVDGQSVDTIEGSGKVITNLALRVSLLSTFYKNTFLVCLFDEIDESLHEDRFEYMEESFNKLVGQGYQLILTSHKDYSVDNIINMGTFND